MNHIIRTVYKEKTSAPEQEQWWMARLDNREFHTLNNNHLQHFSKLYSKDMEDYATKLGNTHISNIVFTPLVAPDPLAEHSRQYHRGWTDDKNPFVIFGKRIPEFEMKVSRYYVEDHFEVRAFVATYSYGALISTAARKWLEDKFEKQLLAACNDSLLQYLISRAKKEYYDKTVRQINELTDSIPAFIETAGKLFNCE